MLGDLKPYHKRSHPKAKRTKMLMILKALQMQCYGAMRDLSTTPKITFNSAS